MASLALPALIAGCAQEKTASTGEQAQEYLDHIVCGRGVNGIEQPD